MTLKSDFPSLCLWFLILHEQTRMPTPPYTLLYKIKPLLENNFTSVPRWHNSEYFLIEATNFTDEIYTQQDDLFFFERWEGQSDYGHKPPGRVNLLRWWCWAAAQSQMKPLLSSTFLSWLWLSIRKKEKKSYYWNYMEYTYRLVHNFCCFWPACFFN